MSIEIKRAVELTLVDLLKESLPDMDFYPSRGGGNDSTPDWQASFAYIVGDIIRPTNHSLLNAIVVIKNGTSSTEPAFDDTVGSTYDDGSVQYQTIGEPAVTTPADARAIEAPMGIVTVTKAILINDLDTWSIEGEAEWVTSMDREAVNSSSREAQQVFGVLNQIVAGYDEYRHLTVHGFYVSGSEESNDDERQSRRDKFTFTMGVTANRFI